MCWWFRFGMVSGLGSICIFGRVVDGVVWVDCVVIRGSVSGRVSGRVRRRWCCMNGYFSVGLGI